MPATTLLVSVFTEMQLYLYFFVSKNTVLHCYYLPNYQANLQYEYNLHHKEMQMLLVKLLHIGQSAAFSSLSISSRLRVRSGEALGRKREVPSHVS